MLVTELADGHASKLWPQRFGRNKQNWIDVNVPIVEPNKVKLMEVSFRQPASFSTRMLVH